jgi:hypothetical protein
MALPRFSAEDRMNLARDTAATRQSRYRTRKIFIIKQTSRLPSAGSAGGKMRRILVFDNHPDSLRLVFGPLANRYLDPSVPPRAVLWTSIIGSLLTIAVLVGMFWPLF